jgi:hypothetical protein
VSRIVAVEEQLVRQAPLDQAVRDAEHEHRDRSPSGPAGHLADEQRPAAVHRCEQRQEERDLRDGEVPQQALADQRGEDEEPDRGSGAAAQEAHAIDHRPVAAAGIAPIGHPPRPKV